MSSGNSTAIGKAIRIVHSRKNIRNAVRKLHNASRPRTKSDVRMMAGRARIEAANAAGLSKVLRVPITNTFDYSDYSAAITVGSREAVVNVILDTGSSTLGVDPSAYAGRSDTRLTPTTFTQIVTYGTGGWAGPVVKTTVNLDGLTLAACPVAIATVQEPGNFEGVTGILGLAYYKLNDAYDFKSYLAGHGEQFTYPWTLGTASWQTEVKKLESIIASDKLQPGTLTPYFDQLEGQGVVANKFAFWVKRSWASQQSANWKSDPINQGIFVLGGGQEQADLYQPGSAFVDVAVLDDVYYNTNLKAVRVGKLPAVAAAPLQAQFQQDSLSNSIIDSGTSDLTLAQDVFDAILAGLKATNPQFHTLAVSAQQQFDRNQNGIASNLLELAAWPDITFTLTGDKGQDVELNCSPSTYWQVDFPVKGQAVFQISGPLDQANQSILGLPLLNNYYTVFDRSRDSKGVVSFAPIR